MKQDRIFNFDGINIDLESVQNIYNPTIDFYDEKVRVNIRYDIEGREEAIRLVTKFADIEVSEKIKTRKLSIMDKLLGRKSETKLSTPIYDEEHYKKSDDYKQVKEIIDNFKESYTKYKNESR